MKIIGMSARWLFVVCFLLLLITTNIRWAAHEIKLYEHGFNKYGVSDVTGIGQAELKTAATRLIDYFNSKVETPQMKVIRDGSEFDLFNERELVHLEDVKALIQLDYHVQIGSLILVIVCSLVLLFWRKYGSWRALASQIAWGSIVSVFLILALALGAIFGFERLFLQFHLVSFHNLYWILDPSQDYLIMMFPGGFFQDASLFVCGATIIEALFLGGISWWALRSKRG